MSHQKTTAQEQPIQSFPVLLECEAVAAPHGGVIPGYLIYYLSPDQARRILAARELLDQDWSGTGRATRFLEIGEIPASSVWEDSPGNDSVETVGMTIWAEGDISFSGFDYYDDDVYEYESERIEKHQLETVARGENPFLPLLEQLMARDEADIAAEIISGQRQVFRGHGEPISPLELVLEMDTEELVPLLQHPDREVRQKVLLLVSQARKNDPKRAEGSVAPEPVRIGPTATR